MIRILESNDNQIIYKNIFRLIQKESELDSDIKNIHSIDVNKSNDGLLNITFDYKDDFRVSVKIDNDEEIIIDALDNIKNYFSNIINKKYPQYIIKRY